MHALNFASMIRAHAAVLRWLQHKERRHRETPKAPKQEWFKTVFKATEGDLIKTRG
jgi:hypothetical protein